MIEKGKSSLLLRSQWPTSLKMNNSSGAFWREGVFRTGQTIVKRSMVTVPKDGKIFLLPQVLDPF